MPQNDVSGMRSTARIAGILLASGFLLLLLALAVMIASGGFQAYLASIQGSIEARAANSAVFRFNTLLYAVSWIVPLPGFGLLARMLQDDGDEFLAVPAFTAVFVGAILGMLHGTFNMTVEIWAAEIAAGGGIVPGIYTALEEWVSVFFKIGYLLHLAAMAGFGWAILRTGLLPPWLGAAAAGWSLLWLFSGLVGGGGAPAIPLIMPAVIGAALFWAR